MAHRLFKLHAPMLAALLAGGGALAPASAQLLPRGLPEVFFSDLFPGIPSLTSTPAGDVAFAVPRSTSGFGSVLEMRVRDAADGAVSTFTVDAGTSGTPVPGHPVGFAVAGRTNGDFLVVFSRFNPGTQSSEIAARQFTRLGAPVGSEQILSAAEPGVAQLAPSAVCNRVGRCVVLWWNESPPGGSAFLRGRILDGLSNPPEDTFRIDPPAGHSLRDASLALADDGRFAVAFAQWRTIDAQPSPVLLHTPVVRLYTALGTVLMTLPLEQEAAPTAFIASRATAFDASGRLVVAWTRATSGPPASSTMRARWLDVFGNTLHAIPDLDPSHTGGGVTVAWEPDGERFAFVWRQLEPLGEDSVERVVLRLATAEGELLGETLVAEEIVNEGFFSVIRNLDLAFDGASALQVIWPQNPRGGLFPPTPIKRVVFAEPDPACLHTAGGQVRPACVEVGPGGRFLVRAHYRGADGRSAAATAEAITPNAAFLFFQGQQNPEVVAKVLDGRTINDHLWYFSGAMSNQEYSVSVLDQETGRAQVYFNRIGLLRSLADTGTFNDEELAIDAEAVGAGFNPAPDVDPAMLSRGEAIGPNFTRAALNAAPTIATRGAGCNAAAATSLCLNQNRFRVEITFRDLAGNLSLARAVQTTTDGGYFTFFNPNNVEVALKILDGTAINGKFWVFYASLSNVRFTVRVFDQAGSLVKTYVNPRDTLQSVADTGAF